MNRTLHPFYVEAALEASFEPRFHPHAAAVRLGAALAAMPIDGDDGRLTFSYRQLKPTYYVVEVEAGRLRFHDPRTIEEVLAAMEDHENETVHRVDRFVLKVQANQVTRLTSDQFCDAWNDGSLALEGWNQGDTKVAFPLDRGVDVDIPLSDNAKPDSETPDDANPDLATLGPYPILGDHKEQRFYVKLELPITVGSRMESVEDLRRALAENFAADPRFDEEFLGDLAEDIEVTGWDDPVDSGLPPAPGDPRDWTEVLGEIKELPRASVRPTVQDDAYVDHVTSKLNDAVLRLYNNTLRDCGIDIQDFESERISLAIEGLSLKLASRVSNSR
jgi:hypothetical protein